MCLCLFTINDKGCESVDQLNAISLVTAGGLGGAGFWAVCYPIDIVKSKIQIDTPQDQKYKGIIDCFKKVICNLFCLSKILYFNKGL